MTTNHPRDCASIGLSPDRRTLLRLMNSINFGLIEELQVRSGEPVLTPLPRIVQERRFGSEEGPRVPLGQLPHRKQVRELLQFLTELGDGVIGRLEVKHGLPFRVKVEQAAPTTA